jgi:hypothetical protein
MNQPVLSIENGVLVGNNGWLFLWEGSNDVGKLFCDATAISTLTISKWARSLRDRSNHFDTKDIKYVHFSVPDKLSIYREEVPSELKMLDKTPSSIVFKAVDDNGLQSNVVDIQPAMHAAKRDKQLYWKTDTHWKFAGACVAHKTLCSALGADMPADLFERPETEISLMLDLGSKLNTPIAEVWSAPQILRKAKLTYKNSMVRFLEILSPRHFGDMHSGASVGFENASANCDPRRVLIFGDSYFEYRPHSLTGLFAETFSEVRFVWSNSIDYQLVNSYRPDIVITEIAERFVNRIPDDSFDLDRYAANRICSFLNEKLGDINRQRLGWIPF